MLHLYVTVLVVVLIALLIALTVAVDARARKTANPSRWFWGSFVAAVVALAAMPFIGRKARGRQ